MQSKIGGVFYVFSILQSQQMWKMAAFCLFSEFVFLKKVAYGGMDQLRVD
jgi:hypothetical protein